MLFVYELNPIMMSIPLQTETIGIVVLTFVKKGNTQKFSSKPIMLGLF